MNRLDRIIRSTADNDHNLGGRHEIKSHRQKQKSTRDSNRNESSSNSATIAPSRTLVNKQQSTADQDSEIPIKFRLSNGKEHRLYCKPNEKFRTIKRRLAMLENGAIDSHVQRLFFGGKLLRKFT